MRIDLSEAQIIFVRKLVRDHMEAQSNWMESSLLNGKTQEATTIAQERVEARDIYRVLNGAVAKGS